MVKRIYLESVKKWALISGVSATTMIGLLFTYLTFLGVIEITGFSGDQICAGTVDDPCYAYVNLTAKEDVFIYPVGYDPWGRNTIFEFTPGVKDWKLQRSWGKGWRDIPLNETCTGTWCGAPNSDGVSYSYVLREGRDYQFRVVAYKNSPSDHIKWAVNYKDREYLDPAWLPIQNWTIEGDSVYINDSLVYINITPHTSNNPIIEFESKVYTGNVDIVFGFNTDKAKPVSAKINPRIETVQKSYTCEYEFNYTVSPNYMWCYKTIQANLSNGTEESTIIFFEGVFESGDIATKTIFWSEQEEVWDDISESFNKVNYEFEGFNEWHYMKDIPITQGELYKLKIQLQSLSFNENYKYFFGIKPSSETLQEAISLGHFYYLDPWTEALNSSLESYYTFNEETGNLLDYFGTYNLTEYGTVSSSAGIINNSRGVYSTSDYFLGDISTTISTSSIWSISVWYNMTSDNTAYRAMYETDDLDNTNELFVIAAVKNDKVYVQAVYRGILAQEFTSTGDINFNTWNNLIVIHNSSGGDFYIYNNGVYLGSTGVISAGSDSAEIINIGKTYDQGNPITNGYVDELGIWSRGLLVSEIESIWNNGDGISISPISSSGTLELTEILTTPSIVYTNTDWKINLTATDPEELYIDSYVQFYVNDSKVGGEQTFNMTNNTNHLVATLGNGNFSDGYSLIAQIWVSNRVNTTEKQNRTSTVQGLNLTGTLKDGNSNNLNGSVFIVNQSDNSLVGNTTALNGVWTFGPISPGTYIITGYKPNNSTIDGDSEPHVVIP